MSADRSRCPMRPRKHQAPNSKLQRNTKHQAPNKESASPYLPWEFGIWSFSGAWSLELGASSVRQRQRHNSVVEKIIHLSRIRSRIPEDRVRVGAINVLVALPRNQEPGAGGDDDVVRQQRPVLDPETAIEPDLIAGAVREQDLPDYFRLGHPDVVHVQERFQFRRAIGVVSIPEDDRAGIHEVRLAFAFARPQIDHETIALLKVHRGAAEIESLVNEERERAADEKWLVENRVEPGGVRVPRIIVAAGVKAGELEAQPILVDR